MRDPETRRGVPLRAGVSLVAVAATVAATFALAGPASAATLTQTPAAATVAVGQSQSYSTTVPAPATLTITVTEPASAGNPLSTGTNPLTITGTGLGAETHGNTTNWTDSASITTTTTPQTVTFSVTSTQKGTVTIATSDGTNTGSSTQTVTNIGSVTINAPKDQSAFAGTAASYTVTAKNPDGTFAAAGTPIHISASEAPAAGQANGPNLTINSTTQAGGNTGGTTPTATTTTVNATTTVSGTGGQATFTLESSQAGTVNFSVAADNDGAASTTIGDTGTLTVAASSGAVGDNVTALAVSPTSVKQYASDGSSSISYTVTATGAGNVAVNGAQVMYQVTQGSTTSAPQAFGALTAGGGKVTSTIPNSQLFSGTSGSGTVKFWVNYTLANGGATNGPDSGEPNVSATYQIDATPTGTVSVTAPDTTAGDLAAGAQNVNLTLNVTNGATAVSGANVAVDVNLSGAPSGTTNPARYQGVTDSDGNVTVSVPVSSVEGANGNTLVATPYISESKTVGSGTAGAPLTVTFATPVVTNISDGGITAVANQPGGTVTVPVTVTDQFNKPIGAGTAVVYNVSTGANPDNGNNAVGKVATINSSGQATVSYTDVSGQTDYTKLNPETIHFTSIAGKTTGLPADITVTYVKSTAPTTLTVTTQPGTLSQTVDKTSASDQQVQFTLSNDAGTLAGQPVTVTVDRGFVGSANTVDSSGAKSVTVATNSSGVATVYVGSAETGVQTITATAGGLSTAAKSVTYTARTATTTTLTGPTKAIAPGSTGTFVAKVADDYGNGVSGVAVTFTATDESVLPGSIRPVVGTTGADGTTSITITVPADSTSAGGTITATANGASAPAAPNNTASAAYTVGSSVSQVKVAGIKGVGVGGTEKIAVRVWNSDGSLAGGATVNVKVTGANTASGTATTGANGELGWFSYTAKNAGTDHVTATIDGKTATTTVTISSAISSHLFHPVAQANGTFLYSVQTTPATAGARVNLFAVYHPGKADQALFHAGNSTTNANGRAARATSPGYLVHGHFKHYRAGATYVLVAKVVGSAGQSNMSSATAK